MQSLPGYTMKFSLGSLEFLELKVFTLKESEGCAEVVGRAAGEVREHRGEVVNAGAVNADTDSGDSSDSESDDVRSSPANVAKEPDNMGFGAQMVENSRASDTSGRNRDFTHINSQVVEAIARYPTSALERATIFCFLLFQETTFFPIDMQKPIVDRLSMGDPAQSASQ
ncbi:hypothetical protein CR513_43960, partial [Mucuna pruriens]